MMKPPHSYKSWLRFRLPLVLAALASSASPAASTETVHVWEKFEITLRAEGILRNPYTNTKVWVDLKGPAFEKRCYGFWDGSNLFRVRILATAPGAWSWQSGAQPPDRGLAGITGAFTAIRWTAAEKEANPCRRGALRPSPNGHAFQYDDGTPFFLVGDTWWAIPTFRFCWHDDDRPRPLGPDAGFKDYVQFRQRQQFNCLAMIAAFPNWANDDQPATLRLADGTYLRAAWGQKGTTSAKDMTNEFGQRAFLFPGKVPGYEDYFPDLDRLNPEYFRALDQKIDYLNAHGIIPFIEVARRDIGQAWKKYYPWPESYTRYIQYVWSRYQANICLYSPIHLDSSNQTIPVEEWNLAANKVIDDYGAPPFGTLAGTNPDASSLRNWGHIDRARWLGFHQIGNRRTHDSYALLQEIFKAIPPVPGLNGEPYYDGMENAEPGGETAALYCRSAAYGSVLSGGLGGHIYGAGGWEGGMWSGEVEAASRYPIWTVIQWPSADQMRHLKTLVMSEGNRYQELEPAADWVAPNQSSGPKTNVGWAYCSRNPARDLYLIYFEKECLQATLSGAVPGTKYQTRWFNPRTGDWLDAGALTANPSGQIALPLFPGKKTKSDQDWAMKLTTVPSR